MDNVTRLLMQGAAGAGSKTYVDDVFSTYLYSGTAGSQSINTGLDMTEGGLTWIKVRTQSGFEHALFDTERGNNVLQSNSNIGQVAYADGLTSFNNNGFTLGADTSRGVVNQAGSGWDYASWSFRKAPGFFDVVTYTGTGSARTVSHNLGSVPGCIMVKRTDGGSEDWVCYHRGISDILGNNPGHYYIYLNTTNGYSQAQSRFNNVAATSTEFTVGTDNGTNGNGFSYVAYIFAGGESTADTARSVDFDGSSDYLSIADNSDFTLGSGDFTFEAWVKIDALNANGAGWLTDWATAAGGLGWYFGTAATGGGSNRFIFGWSDTGSNINTIDSGHTVKADGQFHHYSITRSGTTLYFFVDGNLIKTNAGVTESFYNPSGAIAVGQNPDVGGSAWLLNGKISNLRLVKGTCLYTTSFRPPTKPLTSITNTVLLCCNNSSVTGSTVTPSTITAVGSPTASSDSPFDDPEGYKFGEGGDQNIVKCGSYIGNQNADGPEVHLGWEPQWIILNPIGGGENWGMWDSMRGIVTGGNDMRLLPNTTHAEIDNFDGFSLTPTGFKITSANHLINPNGTGVVYIAIRRPDGLVGKPAEAGTDVFTMDQGRDSSTIPNFDSGFPVDFAIARNPSATDNNLVGSRLTGTKYLITNSNTNGANSATGWSWDSNLGWNNHGSYGTSYLSWMWKRGAGFDVVTYTGNEYNMRQIPHSLGITPEMMWLKYRAPSGYNEDWQVYHKGLNGGVDPQDYAIRLDSANAEYNSSNDWADKAPTSTHFTIGGSDGRNNRTNSTYITMLFASVDGISKVGYYDGSDSAQTITTGFSPRFVIIKRSSDADNWFVLDTTRGYGSGNDQSLELDTTNAQSSVEAGAPTSTGFTVPALSGNEFAYGINGNGYKFVYYAHA